jgi:hypothetical protein
LTSGSYVYGESEIFSGLADRINPHPFGTPQPGDGILAAGKDISIQFNEPINAGLLRPVNFEITGVLNGGTVRNSASMEFAGVANHYMEIPEGIEFNKKSFSVDFNLSRKQFGEQIILSQGSAEADALEIGFDPTDRIYFRIGNKKLTSQARTLDSKWTHYAFVYNHETGVASISINASTHPDDIDNDFLVDYVELGKITIGKARYNSTKLLNARMHELRIWNRALTQSSVSIIATKRLNRTEFGLVGNWRMEEGEGEIAFDHIRSKNDKIFGNWTIEPSGFAYSLTGNSYLTAKSLAYTAENNFTIEFWFKRAPNTDSVTLISNGIGDGRDVNKTGWSIGADTEGKLFIANNGEKFSATSKSYFDDVWHHMAVSVNRITSTNVYIDGKQVSSYSPVNWVGFGGSKIWIGSRGWFVGALENTDQYFGGQFDDIRVWSLAKTAEQIDLQRKNKLEGNEIGLDAYYSFETFIEDAGVLVKSFTMDNQSTKPSADDVLQLNGTGSGGQTDNTPTINLPRPVRKLSFTFTSNGDKIIISPTEPEYLMEGVILNIVVRDVFDLNGNKLQSPVSWTAFYNKNTVLWGDASKNLTLELGNTTSFQTTVVNAGGRVESWSISNIPDWLKVSPSSGTLDPLTSKTITISVPEGVNLGKYSQDLFLTSDYGYNEPFLVDLKVFQNPPSNWKVTETDFEYSMSVVGKLLIAGRVSQNPDDIVAAFVGDECRGLVNMRYIDLYDQHFAFLNIFSNKVSGEEIELRVWDAANGRVYTDVTPQISFISESRIGRASAPVNIVTGDQVQLEREVVKGWQWLSFNINSNKMRTVKDFMAKFNGAAAGDIIKSQSHFDTYDPANNWIGTITNNGGFKNDIMYKFKLSNPGIIQVSGVEEDPSSVTINIKPGWNWISFTSQRNLDINTALSNYNASIGDEVKTQRGFAVYEGPMIRWVGSLTFLNYGSGIMLKSTQTTSFKFPSVPLNSRVNYTEDTQIQNALTEIGITQYESNMTLVARSEVAFENGNMLKVFNGEVLVGYAYSQEVNGESYLFITVYGNKSNTMLEMIDDNGVSYHVENMEVLTFTPDATFGTLVSPVNILSTSTNLEEFEKSIVIYPNPFESIIEVRTSTEFNSLTYELFDVSGRLIESNNLPASYSNVGVTIKPKVNKGLYLLKVYGDGNLLRTVKLIKE